MTMKATAAIFSAAMLMSAATAFADTLTDRDRDYRDYKTEKDLQWHEKQVGVELGAGTGGFTDSANASATSVQGNWTGRFIFGVRSHLGVEAAYVGQIQSLSGGLITGSPRLLGNGAEGALRLNLFTGVFQPYLTGGVGWTHYNIIGVGAGSLATSDVNDRADVAQFPLGVGLAIKPGAFIIDARLAFHPTVGGEIFNGRNMNTWDVGARLGFVL